MTYLIEYGDRVTITDVMDDRAVFAVNQTGIGVTTSNADQTGPLVQIMPAEFLALLRVAVQYVDGMAAGVADVLAAHHATPETIPVPVTATEPTEPATRLYGLPSGEVAEVSRMESGPGWMAVWWGSREDFDADRADAAEHGMPWSDRATVSAVLDTEAEAVAELGDGAKLLIGASA